MSEVAQRSWAGRHRRGSRCVPLGGHRQGRLRERDIRAPACHNIQSIRQEQYCHKRIISYGGLRLAWPLLAAWGGPCGMERPLVGHLNAAAVRR